MIKARVIVTLKPGILDPQGQAISNSLSDLGFNELEAITQGKVFDLNLNLDCREKAHQRVSEMCDILLSNNVIENYSIDLKTE